MLMAVMFEEVARHNLLVLARAYAQATGLSLASVGHEFYGNQAFFKDMEKGPKAITTTKYDQIVLRFSERWPRGWPWPGLTATSTRRPRK